MLKDSSAARYINFVFNGDLVYESKRIVGKPYFRGQFKQIIKRYKRVGYSMDIMRQSACLVVNPITIDSYARRMVRPQT